MTVIDNIARKEASKAIRKYGKAITLHRVTNGALDPATGSASVTVVNESVSVAVEEYKGYDFANDLAKHGDKKLTLGALGIVAPSLGDKITIDTIKFSIVQIQTIYSGAEACLYVIQARV